MQVKHCLGIYANMQVLVSIYAIAPRKKAQIWQRQKNTCLLDVC